MGGMTGEARIIVGRSMDAPQWSPPVMGGMTAGTGRATRAPRGPQWSPPVMGGMTHSQSRSGSRQV